MTSLDHAAVAALAHQIWVRRGRLTGEALSDWLEAERQLLAKAAAEAHAHTPPAAPVRLAPPPPAPKAAAPASKKKVRGGKRRR